MNSIGNEWVVSSEKTGIEVDQETKMADGKGEGLEEGHGGFACHSEAESGPLGSTRSKTFQQGALQN